MMLRPATTLFDRRRVVRCCALAALACVCVWGGAGAPVAKAGPTLRVLTYNIHHSEGRDGVFDLARIAGVITAANPDLVALQELDQGNERSGTSVFQLDQLAQLTGMQGFFGKTIDYRGGAYGNGVLVRSGLHVTESINRPLPSPVGGEARGVLEVGVSLNGADDIPEFRFLVTHFTATSGDDASRLSQAAYVNSLVASTPASMPTLLAGDFNARPSSPAMQRIGEEWADVAAQPIFTQIDHIRYRSDDQWKLVAGGAFIVDPTTRVASDHFPYLATVQLVPEPPALTLVGACGGLVVAMRRPLLGATRCTVGDGPTPPPCAKGVLGGRSPAARAACCWPGCAGKQETSAVARGGRNPCSVLACCAAARGAAHQLREARRAPGRFSQ